MCLSKLFAISLAAFLIFTPFVTLPALHTENPAPLGTPYDAQISALLCDRTFQSFTLNASGNWTVPVPESYGQPVSLYQYTNINGQGLLTRRSASVTPGSDGLLHFPPDRSPGYYCLVSQDAALSGIIWIVFDLRVLDPSIRDRARTPKPDEMANSFLSLPGKPLLSNPLLAAPAIPESPAKPSPTPLPTPIPTTAPKPSTAPTVSPMITAAPAVPAPTPVPPIEPAKEWIFLPRLIILTSAVLLFLLIALLFYRSRQIARLRFERDTLRDQLHLEDRRLAESAQSLESLRESLERNQKESRRFLGKLSHELRIPISVIQGYTNILSTGLVTDEPLREIYLKKIYEKTEEISNLFSNLLASVRLKEKSPNTVFEYCNLYKLLSELITDYSPLFLSHGIQLVLNTEETSVQIYADRIALSQAIQNILQNSLKYMGQPGSIVVTLAQAEEEALIVLRDDGNGMEPESLPLIFDRYYRADPGSEDSSGLGLYLTSEVVTLHGGRIWAKSALGQGMTTFILLPLCKTPSEGESRTGLSQEALSLLPDTAQKEPVHL